MTDEHSPEGDDILITQKEAAELRGLSRARINKLVHDGRLRTVWRYGKDHVYLSEVLAYRPRTRGPGRKPEGRND